MLLLTILIALTNLALGYALAVHLGWASWPTSRNAASQKDQPPAARGHGH